MEILASIPAAAGDELIRLSAAPDGRDGDVIEWTERAPVFMWRVRRGPLGCVELEALTPEGWTSTEETDAPRGAHRVAIERGGKVYCAGAAADLESLREDMRDELALTALASIEAAR